MKMPNANWYAEAAYNAVDQADSTAVVETLLGGIVWALLAIHEDLLVLTADDR
jgi:hypothetical protein